MSSETIKDQKAYNASIRTSWLPIWTRNAVINYPFIKERFDEKHWDVFNFKSDFKIHKHAFVLGSGPSLDRAIKVLDKWEGDIYCSSSQLLLLQAKGIVPRACFIIDSDPSMSYLVKEVDTKNIPLITNPCMDPEILKSWEGPIYFFRMYDPGDPLFAEFIPHIYQNIDNERTRKEGRTWGINTHVLNGGCIVNTMCAVLPTFGVHRTFLAGVDYGFPNNVHRFTNVHLVDGEYVDMPARMITDEMAPMVGENGVKTDKVSTFYKYSTVMLWGMDKADIVTCSEGLLTEFPYVSPEEVVEKQGEVGVLVEPEERYQRARKYLAKHNIFIVNTKAAKKIMNIQNLKGFQFQLPFKWEKLSFYVEYFWNRLRGKW